jgi:hypothetical protein
MYVKNISQLLKEQLPLKLRLSEGSSIYGKIISQDGKNGLIKLYDGTIIPAIFISENKLLNDRFIKFVIEQFNDEALVLKVIDDTMNPQGEDSINALIKKLNIPREEGTKIINSLIRFNLSATDENVMTIYKNITFLEKLGKMADDDILNFLHTYIEGDFTPESKEFSIAKEMFSKLLKIDTDFLSFLVENEIPFNIENILKSSDFIENKFSINNMINSLKNLLEMDNKESPIGTFTDTIKELISKPEVLPIIHEYLEDNLYPGGEKSNVAQEAFAKLSNVNVDYLSLLIERELPAILEGSPDAYNFVKDKDLINNLISELKNLLATNKEELFTSSFKDIIKDLSEKPEFLLRNYIDGKLASDGEDFHLVEEAFSKSLKLNTDYISSLLKSKVPSILSSLPNGSDLVKNIADTDKIISALKSIIEGEKRDLSMFSLNNTIKEIMDKPETLHLLSNEILNKFSDNMEILRHLCNNYNIYFFNTYNNHNMFKNNIIIKNKYKPNTSIDPDDVKVFITVDTPNTGTVEAYLYKKGASLTISIKTENKHISLFRKSVEKLNDTLVNKGYDIINISVESINPQTNMVSLSNFFNDTIFKELDVKV